MGEQEPRRVELPKSEEGLEIQFGAHTVGWYRHAAWFADQIWSSRVLPEHIKTAQQAFAILCKGDELGLPPFAAWGHIYPTKSGRLAIQTKGALAVVQAKPTFDGYEERIENEGTPEMRAVAIATRKGYKPVLKEFSLKDAQEAKLLVERRNRDGNTYDSTYQMYLKDMLLSRARGRALDIAFAAELGGIPLEGIAEEIERNEDDRQAEKPRATFGPPPKRDPLLAAVGQKQIQAGAQANFIADDRVPKDTVSLVNREGQEVGRIVNIGSGPPPAAQPEPATPGPGRPDATHRAPVTPDSGADTGGGDVLDPELVQVISDQVDEVYGPPEAVPAPPPPTKEPVEAHPAPAAAPRGAEGAPTRAAVRGPSLGVAKALGRASICQRCNHKLNEMGGCDVCGWPGKDIR